MDIIETSERAQGKPVNEPRPCDHFEYITGTGIGGYEPVSFIPLRELTGVRVIALLLGRLQLPVSKCMLAYRDLSSLVLRDDGYSPLFDMDKLLQAAKRIVRHYEGRSSTEKAQTAETYVHPCSLSCGIERKLTYIELVLFLPWRRKKDHGVSIPSTRS